MRITLLNKYYYPPHVGGIENHLHMLAGGLRAADVDVDVIVANEGRETVRETIDGIPVLRLGRLAALASTPIAPGMPGAIRRRARQTNATDVFHMHFPYPWGDLSWQLARAATPTVLTYHSDIVRQKRLLKVYEPVMRRLLSRVDRIIVGAPQIAENSPWVSPYLDKVRVVPFGQEVERIAFAPGIADRAAGLRAGHARPIVLFVGRLIYYKGIDVLVRAMAHVDADLVILGRGPLESELREIAQASGIADRVTFLPPVSEEELRAWYHAADVFCLPSVARSEAFGAVQVEAHAAGTPVVSTDLPTGVPYVNQDGVTGLIVPPGDVDALARALQRLASDAELRRRLGEQAARRALELFTIERMVDSTVQVYEEALGRGA